MSKKDRFKNLLDRNDSIENNPTKEEVFTEIQKNVNTETQDAVDTLIQENKYKKKKATFEFDPAFHTQLKVFAAQKGKKMNEIVEAAVKQYIESEQ